MNYKVTRKLLHPETSEKNCYIYVVIETTTDQIIKTFKSEEEARKFMRHLNLGGAFDGFTPTFFVRSVEKLGFAV